MSRKPRVARVSVELPAPGASANWLRGIRFSGFTVLALGMLIIFVVALAPSLKIYAEQQREKAQLQAEVEKQQEVVDDLAQDVARWDDPSYVEAQARERLYYVKPGEFSYLVIDDGATAPTHGGAPISDELQTTQVDWVASLVASVFIAGLTEAPPEELAPIVPPQLQEGTP